MRVALECWTIRQNTSHPLAVVKIAARDERGRFLGSTNYRGSVLRSQLPR